MLWSAAAGASALPDSLLREMPSRQMKNLLVPRSHHMAFVSGEDIVVVGGHTTGFVPTASAEYYHGGRWHPLQSLYTHDCGFRVRLRDGRWMLAGGFDQYLGIGQSYVAEVYDSTTRSFSPLPIMEQKRSLARGMSLRDGTVVISGNALAPDILEVYKPETGPLESRPAQEQRMLPFLFRTGSDDVLLLSSVGNRWEERDTVKLEYLRREGTFSHPLLETWKPIHTCSSNWTPEGCAVQDADRLDAMGASGVARTFAYGGEHGRPMADSVGHFYDKLLRLNALMNTETGREMALQRHAFLEAFLREYLAEEKGEK